MNFCKDHPHITFSGRGLGWMMLIILVLALAACTSSRPGSSGAQAGASSTGTPDPLPSPPADADAGGATLNLNRHAAYEYATGSDVQSETGAIPLKFTKSAEGDLIVEGQGKTEWVEVTNFSGCSYTSKAEGKITVTGLFTLNDCQFHLTIATKFSQPTTTYQDQSPDQCLGSVKFTQTEFSSQVVLDPATNKSKETKEMNWWEISTVNLSDLKSDVVEKCFAPVEIRID